MNITEIKQRFTMAEMMTIKKFLAYINETADKDSKFADDGELETLNQFSDLAESDEEIATGVKDWLRLKKVRLRGAFTPDN
jgi:hypothetical protein